MLKERLLYGNAITRRVESLEQRVADHDRKIDFFVRTSLPPVEGVFYDGQIFDAYNFASDLIRSAQRRVILIDNYVDDSVLLMLAKWEGGVDAQAVTRFDLIPDVRWPCRHAVRTRCEWPASYSGVQKRVSVQFTFAAAVGGRTERAAFMSA